MNSLRKIHIAFIVMVNFVLLHYIVTSFSIRFDMTSDNVYSLSDSTKSMLSNIEEPVRFDFYYTRSVSDLPPTFKNFANRVEQMLQQYRKASRGKIQLNIIDPQPDTSEEENATVAGLHAQPIQSGDNVFLGLIASQGDTEKAIPFFNWQKESFLEYDLSKIVYETQQLAKPRLGLISGLPLKAPPYPAMPGQPAQEDQYILEQLESTFEVELIQEGDTDLPDNLDLLAVIHPLRIGDEMLYAIDQHIVSGKPAFIAVDPSSLFTRSQSQQMGGGMGQMNPDESSDFATLFNAWGIEYNPSEIIGDIEIAYAAGADVQPAWLVLRDDQTNKEVLPSSDLDPILLLETGFFKTTESSSLALNPILSTSESAGTLNGMMLRFTQGRSLLKDLDPKGERLVVAGLLSGEFKTAFPEGKPGENQEESESIASGESNVFIIGDTDWVMDQFSIRRMNFLGMSAINPINGNQTLAANFLEYLGGSQDLIGIRGKASTIRNFDVVERMEQEAQKDYQAKLQEMETQRETIQQEIQEIASKQQGSGLIVASPELQESLQKFREQEAELGRSIRDIRRNMRSKITSLGNTLGATNLLYAPILLIIFAIVFFNKRKQFKI